MSIHLWNAIHTGRYERIAKIPQGVRLEGPNGHDIVMVERSFGTSSVDWSAWRQYDFLRITDRSTAPWETKCYKLKTTTD